MALQARTEFAAAINQIASEKGVDTEVIINAIEQAALAAYRKDLSFRNEALPDDFDDLTAKIDPSTGEIGIYRGGDNITPPGFARIAAQTAKQVMAQKLHEAEKGAIIDEYAQKVGAVVSGAIQRQEGNTYYVDIGRAEGVMPPQEQVRDEYYAQNQRLKVYIKEIRDGGRGPEVVVSRADANLVKGLFGLEVPEIQSGAVEIKEIAREAGGRTKVAVISTQEGVDPVGSMVGQKGVRVQNVINELGEEKIDIISYSADPGRFIAAALSPAKDVEVELDEENKVAKVKVADSQLSLAIGKGGQNVRLAAKLTGWKIDIEGSGEPQGESNESKESDESKAKTEEEKIEQKEDAGASQDDAAQTADDQQTVSQTSDDTSADAVEEVEKSVDKVMEEESLDGAVVEEPTPEEAAVAAADAEKDMEEAEPAGSGDEKSMEEAEGTQRGDLVGDREPREAEEAPVETAPAADFEAVEEEKMEKEKAVEDSKSQDE